MTQDATTHSPPDADTTQRYLLIGELAKKCNTTKDTIRHYQQLGLLKYRERQASSRVYFEYHPASVERIKIIKAGQAIGFTLKEIAASIDDFYQNNISIKEQLDFLQEKLEIALRQQHNLTIIINEYQCRIDELKQMQAEQREDTESVAQRLGRLTTLVGQLYSE